MNNNFKNFFKKNGFFVAICSVVAILLVSTLYFSYNTESGDEKLVKDDEIVYEPVNKSDVKSYKEQSTEQITEDISEETTMKDAKIDPLTETTTVAQLKEDTSEETTQKNSAKNDDATKSPSEKQNDKTSSTEEKTFTLFDDTKEMSWPVSGQIVMDYSTETAIFDKTLEQYRTNDSICISAPEKTPVLASAEGVVEKVFKDEESGNTIVLNHGNGWLSTYSQLEDNILVAVGQIVDEGEKIANIGSPTSYSLALGPHLDFKITKNDESSDPKLVLAEAK